MAGQTNFINASGDILGEGGYIYLFPNKQSAVAIAEVKNGTPSATYTSAELRFAGSTAGYVIPLDNNRENWLYQVRANGIVEYSGGESTDILTGRASTTQPNRNSTGGGALIQEGANRILIHNSGTNYVGGFTVRDITLDKVIANVAPIGNKGYTDGGNYSTFNWLIAERTAKADYTVYQYCPANGMAVYHLYDPTTGVENVSNTAESIAFDGTTVSVDNACGIELFDTAGRLVAVSANSSMNVNNLAKGIYIVRSGDKTLKIKL